MANVPRKHHYVPQFHLAKFTDGNDVNSVLHVVDLSERRLWKSSPRESGHRRDFYAVDLGGGQDPMFVEKRLADQEGRWAQAISTVCDSENLPAPGEEALAELMMFIGFAAARVPRIRDTVSEFVDRVIKKEAFALLSTGEGRRQFREYAETDGKKLTDNEFQQLIDFGLNQQYTADYEQTWHVQTMLHVALRLPLILCERTWRLWIAKDEAVPDFICSDSPVGLRWVIPPDTMSPLGFAMENTLVTVPLSRRTALVGTYETELEGGYIGVDEVAMINAMTAAAATKLYCPKPDFVWRTNAGKVAHLADLFAKLDRQKQSSA